MSSKINWNELKGLNNEQIEKKVEEILAMMTIKDKARCMQADWSIIIEGLKMLKRYNYRPIPAGVNKKLGIPGILFTDGPRGVVMGASTCFPVSMARGAAWDLDLEERIGNVIGIEARAQGANYFGGVCINLLRHPAWGRAQETYGEDTFLLGEMGAALVRGTQKHVMACAKHYACNSMENARFKVDVQVDERTLREVYLAHFKRCVDEGVASIMNAYNKVNGFYCGHNHHLLTEILKEDWKFEGFVITDFILGIRDGLKAINAGVDIEYPFKWRMKSRKILKWLAKGKINESQIDDSVRRILREQLKINQIANDSLYTKDKIVCEEHIQLALEAARKSIVLLKNENNLLPLKKEKVKRIAVLGKLAGVGNIGDHGSSRVYPPYIRTPLEGIYEKAGKNIEVVYDEGQNLEFIERLVENVDVVVIVVGFTRRDEGEYVGNKGGDRDLLELRRQDENLIIEAALHNKNCIVVLEGGSSIITEDWREKVPAILMGWYPGMEGGNAIADILFGYFNPCAKLPVVFPKSQDQLPFFDKKAKSIVYEYLHGYKLMDQKGEEPAFPFGYGLSYTTFSYDNMMLNKEAYTEAETIEVSIDITNTGKIEGAEIVQLYIEYIDSKVERPKRDLKGFGRVELKPGETKPVKIKIKAADLAYYNIEEKKWITEKIEYIAHVGSSSRDIHHTKKFKIS
ncbi:MAG: beta-glucosidase family protein [Promethearchaeota archaeon]